MPLTYDELYDTVTGPGVGIRARTEFDPLGGPGDKVFPPTYGVDRTAETKYAVEQRTINGELVETVILDSVASQANRFETALLEARRDGRLGVPLISVDFSGTDDLADLDRISALEASHRVFDAILRDSLLGDTLFRLSDIGRRITEADPKSAAALFHHSPTTLLFGGWDSTGPKGGKGAKYERALSSEIIGIGATRGVRTSSRIDALGVELKAGPVYESEDGEWTLDPDEARKEKGKPVEVKGSAEGRPGRPSHVNHGNITPSIDELAGGVTVDQILGISVLSFIQLRRLRFPVDSEGTPIPPDARTEAEGSARTALAALGLAAMTLAFENGFDLRSRCVLVPVDDLQFELILRGATEPHAFSLDSSEASALLQTAVERATAVGLPWQDEEVLLQPTERLVELIRRSRALAATGEADEAEAT
ncbi:MAG: type I-U CRISPR-associated RAMP protein Csb1/Cas7u [Acidimicrobiales bacterium]|nr:type I-U CRISPR-associated RAMP protein Csb1/Cas7u [Acidimicrobiales bacterium]